MNAVDVQMRALELEQRRLRQKRQSKRTLHARTTTTRCRAGSSNELSPVSAGRSACRLSCKRRKVLRVRQKRHTEQGSHAASRRPHLLNGLDDDVLLK